MFAIKFEIVKVKIKIEDMDQIAPAQLPVTLLNAENNRTTLYSLNTFKSNGSNSTEKTMKVFYLRSRSQRLLSN